jgi:hypothetical protein
MTQCLCTTRDAIGSIARSPAPRAAIGGRRKRGGREAGCNILELQSRSGHLTLSELQKYIDAADKRFAADRAAEKVIAHKTKQKAARKIAA